VGFSPEWQSTYLWIEGRRWLSEGVLWFVELVKKIGMARKKKDTCQSQLQKAGHSKNWRCGRKFNANLP
jgi:hypothetical protein